jgi:O-methyltransferase
MQLPPSAQLWQIATGHLLPRCLHVVAELGVADYLGDAPMTAEALAIAAGVSAGPLDRMLRLLAVASVFEVRGTLWTHTELSRLIRSDHPQSMRAFIRMIGGRLTWAAAGELEYGARTGKAAVEKLVSGGIWTYFRDHPDEARIFDAAMTAKSNAEIAALIPALDFTRYGVIADVGGGRGHILVAVLAATPNTKGILFDLPQVVANVEPQPRMNVQGGDFFKDPLPIADAYILGNVLHDWADKEAEAILCSVRRSAPDRAELLVLEAILPEGPEAHLAKVLDIVMLTVTGGRERTRREYQTLLEAGGFRLDRIVPTAGPVSVIVGAPT